MLESIADGIKRVDRVLLLTVIIPTFLSVCYFGFIASDVYTAEARFLVRSVDKPQLSGLGTLLTNAGFSNSSEETSAVEEYIRSRDALNELNHHDFVRTAFSRPGVSTFDRFGGIFGGHSAEHLYRFYQGMVSVDRDSGTGVTKLTVKAFTPADAQAMNKRLLELSESLVNQLSERGRRDLINSAMIEVDGAKARSLRAALALSAYRNKFGVVDPEKQATAQMQMVSKLQDQLIATRTQLLQIRTYTPRNTQVEVLQTRVQGLEREIDHEMRKAAGDSRSLAATAVQFQQLQLESQVSEKLLAAALASLQDAQNEAVRKQTYVERVAQPNLPDYPTEPRRFRGVLATFILGLIAWGIARMLLAGVREHQL